MLDYSFSYVEYSCCLLHLLLLHLFNHFTLSSVSFLELLKFGNTNSFYFMLLVDFDFCNFASLVCQKCLHVYADLTLK